MIINDLISSSKNSRKFGVSFGMCDYFLLKSVMLFSFSLSLILSLVFWWSIGNRLTESILFLMFALVFELCKFISLPFALTHHAQRAMFCLNLSIYLLLTVLSILSSIGGIGSCFSNNQAQAIQSSSEYQVLTRQIEGEQTLVDSELATVQTDLAHNYRTQAQALMENEIPQQQKILDQLRQQRDNVHAAALPPSLSVLKMFSENFSASFNHLENLFVAVVAILIEIISTYLMIISLIVKEPSKNEPLLRSERFFESTKTLIEPSTIKAQESNKSEEKNIARKISETPKNLSEHSKSFLEKYEKVLGNIQNKIYDAKITQIMVHEKIGYKFAKSIVEKLNTQENPYANDL